MQDTFLKEPLYVVNTKNFRGYPESTMHKPGIVDYTNGMTLEQYNEENGGGLIAVTWEEYDEKYAKPYFKSLCKPFKRISKAQYWEYLECVPSKKWKQIGSFETFFVGECYAATLYEFCFSYQGKYWSGLRDIYTSEADLLAEMKAKIKNSK